MRSANAASLLCSPKIVQYLCLGYKPLFLASPFVVPILAYNFFYCFIQIIRVKQHAKRRTEEPQPMVKNELIVAERQNINNLFLKKVLAIQPPVSLSLSLSLSLCKKKYSNVVYISCQMSNQRLSHASVSEVSWLILNCLSIR